MRKFLITSFSILLLSFGSLQAASQKYVYRADNRPPEVIFQEGFQPFGNNLIIAEHVLGYSLTNTRNSAFVSTTTEANFAYLYMTDRIREQRGGFYYIYQIRADDNFYSSIRSMNHVVQIHHRRMPDLEFMLLSHENEYLAYHGIPTDHIQSVTIYEYNPQTDQITNLGGSSNQQYVDADTGTNENPFTLSDDYPYIDSQVLLGLATNASVGFNSSNQTHGWCPSCLPPSLFSLHHEEAE